MSRTIHTFEAIWNDIPLTISWEPNWLNLESREGIAAAHLQVRSRDNVPLPITQTGYRSHFTSSAAVTSAGGPVAYALAWLATEADTPEWRAHEAAANQLTLF